MSDHGDRLDAFLNGESGDRENDDHTAFAKRVMREGALPEPAVTEPTKEQRDRIRERVFGEARIDGPGGKPVTTTAFSANGAAPTAMPVQRDDGSRASGLSILMTAALIAIIAVASIGVYRGSLDFLPGGADPNPTGAPGIAAPFEASPEALAACDRDQWFGIFESPAPEIVADTTHLTFIDDTVTLHCGGDSWEIASDVQEVFTFLIGVIAVRTDEAVQLINIETGAVLPTQQGQLLGDDDTITFVNAKYQGHWLLLPENSDRTDWWIIDLRSMESFLISEALGGPLDQPYVPDTGHHLGYDRNAEIAVVTWRAGGAPYSSASPGAGSSTSPSEYTLVLPGTIEDRRWIDIVDYRRPTNVSGGGSSQLYSASADGSLIAYTTLTDTSVPVIRVEQAVSGQLLVDVPIDGIDLNTAFIVTGGERPHLLYANGETVHLFGLAPNATREIAQAPGPDVQGFLPTGDPGTVLLVHNNSGTAVTPMNVANGDAPEFYVSVPPAHTQVFEGDELPHYLVRVLAASPTENQSIIQLVDPTTTEVILESDPVDASPTQIVSFDTQLRNGGELAVVPIGYNRAVVLDASSNESWEMEAPVDDDRLWRFYATLDGRFITAYPQPPLGTSEITESWIAPLESASKWVSIEANNDVEAPMIKDGTPAS